MVSVASLFEQFEMNFNKGFIKVIKEGGGKCTNLLLYPREGGNGVPSKTIQFFQM